MIECYYSTCKNHDYNYDETSGPFCSQSECTATKQELELFKDIRLDYLRKNCKPETAAQSVLRLP